MPIVTPGIKFNLTIDSRTQFCCFAVPVRWWPIFNNRQLRHWATGFFSWRKVKLKDSQGEVKMVTCQKMLWQRPTVADQGHPPPVTLNTEFTRQLLTQHHTSLTAVRNDAIPLFVKFSDYAWERHSGQATFRGMDAGQTSDLIYFTTCTKRLA